MAQKSKTQRAKASAARAERKAAREEALLAGEGAESVEAQASKKTAASTKGEAGKTVKKSETKTKKPNRLVQFFKDVKIEMKRVTWPTKTDVVRWSVVVVAALLFFGIYVAVLDNLIVTPILFGISGLAG
jgi:preprotein translocase subunit SecE